MAKHRLKTMVKMTENIRHIMLKGFIFASVLGLFYAAYVTFSFGLANVHFKRAEKQIAVWQKQQSIKNVTTYQASIDNINSAINLHTNPQYIETKAQIIEWGVREKFEEKPVLALKQAQTLYLKSIAIRPTWPSTWAALALNKWHLSEFDQQLINYLKNAHTFGKNKPEVHIIWATLGQALANSSEQRLKQLIKPYLHIVAYHVDMGKKHPRAKSFL